TQLLLLGEATSFTTNIEASDRVRYLFFSVIRFAPFAYILNGFNVWWQDNHRFTTYMLAALILNAIVGAWMHLKYRTFDFKQFFTKNATMLGVVTVTFVMLEMMRLTAGENVVGDIFKVLIQVTSLLYPASKIIKNTFILSEGKHPPEFIMRKIYNFEKNGDLRKLFSTQSEDLEMIEGFEEFKQKLKNEKTGNITN